MKNDDFESIIQRKASEREYIFFDCFDTLIHRNCHPDTVKQLWAKKISKAIPEVSGKELYLIRLSSEEMCAKKYGAYEYHSLTDEMIKRLSTMCVVDEIALQEAMQQEEQAIEKSVLYKDEAMWQMVHCLRKAGKKICVVSDFYMGKETIRDYLEYTGYENVFEDIFVSCDYHCSKGDGRLYKIVLKELGAKTEECLMIGDHYRCDYIAARRTGMGALHRKYEQKSRKKEEDIKRELHEVFNKEVKSIYDACGFSLYYFAESLLKTIKKENVKHCFFLAREGLFLKKIFDMYLERKNIKNISTHYLYVSRRSTYLPSLKKLEQETFDVLFEYSAYSCSMFLDNLNFTEKEKQSVCKAMAMSKEDFSESIEMFSKSKQYISMLNCDIFESLYEKKRTETKEILLEYLDQFHVDFSKEGLFMVDVGWKGTMQDNLYRLWEGKVRVHGNYVGLTEYTLISPNNIKSGHLFQLVPYPSVYCRQWKFNRLSYEDILSADHPSVKAYRKVEEGVTPVFDSQENPILVVTAQTLQKRILEVFSLVCDVFDDTIYSATDFDALFAWSMVEAIRICKLSDINTYRRLHNSHISNFFFYKTAEETYKEQRIRDKIKKVCNTLKTFHEFFSGNHFLNYSGIICSAKGHVFWFLYREIVYKKEKRIFRKQLMKRR